MKKAFLALIAAVLAIGLVGCETTKGVGKDIQNAGEKMEKAVEGQDLIPPCLAFKLLIVINKESR